ncbi:hypothetical protein P175DRAFT_0346989 [Aspergillus ochraceoroseus IBT 24754]|uniref:Uncharacterized protein n=1 Tax=Aspergillus ochraceoroseus IBT 24754 TaxID=1392256 RepID=A0A2T5LP64_9EURO|nr:uncharacterized protein P175DRAFT_0346989 [Aspergillus ochraceoroseus IBT 24754]PTU18074.1 hypothetical protein P175DRAFT_0346989 [Aspergillus ochraceoroseus IBT 24754]
MNPSIQRIGVLYLVLHTLRHYPGNGETAIEESKMFQVVAGSCTTSFILSILLYIQLGLCTSQATLALQK